MKGIGIEPRLWDLGPASPGTGAKLPKLGRCGHVARQATGHPDDGNGHRLLGCTFRGGREPVCAGGMAVWRSSITMAIGSAAMTAAEPIGMSVGVGMAVGVPIGVAISVPIDMPITMSVGVTIVETRRPGFRVGIGVAVGKVTMQPVAIRAGIGAIRCDSNGCHRK